MRKLIILLVLSGAITAHAETIYFIKGKRVSKGEATITSLQKPDTRILKVQAHYVQASKTTANLKKVSDAPLSDIPR